MVPIAPLTISQPKFGFADLCDTQFAHDGVVEFFCCTNVCDRDRNVIEHVLTLREDADDTAGVLCAHQQ
jgi:hypothetical protein